MKMRAVQLFSLSRESSPNGGACLLIYAEPNIQDAGISSDIREIYNNRPGTSHIYILAPFCEPGALVSSLQEGTSLSRARPYIQQNGSFNVLSLNISADKLQVVATRLGWKDDSVIKHSPTPVDGALINAWLFDLFDRNDGKVTAPLGVHFRKGSGKHTNEFLRTANVLLSSHACGALAFFSLAQLGHRPPRQILVDTAPLISIAQAMFQIASAYGLWTQSVPIKSFSSYGGLESLPRQSQSDLALVSASTSGSLAERLVERGMARKNIVTLFYLASDAELTIPDGTVCNLTHQAGHSFGYLSIKNFNSQNCPLCAEGYILAELEGDQFLFQKRETLRIKIKKTSQGQLARTTVEKLARKGLFEIVLQPNSGESSSLRVAGNKLIIEDEIRPHLIRQIRRFGPSPLKYVVLDDISEKEAKSLLQEAGVYYKESEVAFIAWENLANAALVEEGGAIVLFGLLHDHARARQINATLRRIVPKGSVTYISALTISESPDDLADLKIFLEYGEHGRDTFVFRSVFELAYPSSQSPSAWDAERGLLAEICAEPKAPKELRVRLDVLNTTAAASTTLFLSRPEVQLAINNDFVYLDTRLSREEISQADIGLVVASILTSARYRDRAIHSGKGKDGSFRADSSLYGQALICPENFRNYNDPILRAALLRFARPTELRYAADEVCSAEMLEIIFDEIAAWGRNAGDALPEFLLSLACARLSLDERHMAALKRELDATSFPDYMTAIIDRISF